MEQVNLSVHNAASPSVDHAEAYPGTNTLRLVLTNTAAWPLTLTAATVITAQFTRFNGQRRSPTVSSTDGTWTPSKTDDGTWRMVPNGRDAIAVNESVVFEARDVLVDGKPAGLAHIVVGYVGVGGAAGKLAADVLIQSEPSRDEGGGPRPFTEFGWVGADDEPPSIVYVTERGAEPIENTLVLAFGNPRPEGGGAAPPAGNAEFYLSFIIADDEPGSATDAALTTLKYASGALNAGQPLSVTSNNSDWAPKVQPDFADRDARHAWTFKPPVLPAPNQTVRLIVHNICLPSGNPGQPSFEPDRTTYLFLQYVNVAGFRNGYFFLPIHKKKPGRAILKFFSVTPDLIDPGDPVRLLWQTRGVSRLELSFDCDGPQQRSSASADPGRHIDRNAASYSPLPLPTKAETHYLLRAFNASGETLDKRDETVLMTLPSIVPDSFRNEPLEPLSGRPTQLRWQTTNATRCALSDDAGSFRDVTVPAVATAYPVTPVASTVAYDLVASRGSKSVSARLLVRVRPRIPAGFPVPPFPYEDSFEAVTGVTAAEWTSHLGFPAEKIGKGSFNPGGSYLESVFTGMQEVVVSGTIKPVNFACYVALSGPLARYVDVRFYPSSLREDDFRGWTRGGWVAGPAEDISGYFWYRCHIAFAPPFESKSSVLFAKTYRYSQQATKQSDPPFRLWAYRAYP